MNRVYKVIWSKAKHCYVVTSEIARSVTKSASSARSAGRKGAAVLAMAALLFTAGGVLGEVAAYVTDVKQGSTANEITVTKDDGSTPNTIVINDVAHATAADKATQDGNGKEISTTYVKIANARVGADGEYVKKANTVGKNLSALDAQVKANAGAMENEVANRKAADKDNLKVDGNGVISKVSNDGTTSSPVNKLVLKVDGDNQITMDEKGIKVGTNSTFIGSDGSIKGANGNFTVGTDGKVTAKGGVDTDGREILTRNGNINAGSGDISGKDISASGSLHADGDISGKDISGKDITGSGTVRGRVVTDGIASMEGGKVQGTSVSDGIATLSGGSLTNAVDITASGTITTTGNIKADGTITTNNLAVTGGLETDRITLGSKPKNQTDIYQGNVTSKVNDTVSGVEYTAESIFNKDGSSITARTDVGEHADSTGKSIVGAKEISQYLGDAALPDDSKKNVTRSMVRNGDTFYMEDKAEDKTVDGKNKYSTVRQNAGERTVTVTDGENTASTNLTAADIKNTAENGMISNTAKNLVNTASENMTNTVGGNLTTTVTGDSSLTAENITNEAKNKITNKALDVETDAASSIVSKVSNDYGSNTSTQLSHQTKEEMSQADGKTASYLRGAAEEKSQLINGDKKTTIDTIAGQTNTNITEGKNVSNSLQKADQIASSVTDSTNTTVVNQDAKSLASSVTDGTNTTVVNQDARSLASAITDGTGTKVNNSFHWVDGSAQRIEVDDTHFYAETRTAETAVETLQSGKTQINIVKDTNTATVSSAVLDGATITDIRQNAKDISLSAAGGTITNDANDVLNKGANSVINEVGANQVAVMTDSVKAAYGLDTYTTWDGNGITSNTSGNMSNTVGGKMLNDVTGDMENKVGRNLTNSAVEIENKASSSIWNHVGEGYNTSWKMTGGKISESIVNGTASNKENTTAEGTKRIITSDEGTGTYNQTATSNNISLKNAAGDTYFTKSESLDGEKTSVKNSNGSSTINQSAESIVNFVKNSEGTTKTEQSAVDIKNTAKNGTITNDAKTLRNKASESITDKVGENVKRTMTTDKISESVKDGTNTSTLSQLADKVNTSLKEVDGEGKTTKSLSNVKTVSEDTTKITDAASGAFSKRSQTVSQIQDKVGKTTVTITNNGLAVTGGTTTDTLKVEGTSEFGGKAAFKDDVSMDKKLTVKGAAEFKDDVSMGKNLTVTGKTETGILHVNGDGYVGGDLTVKGNIETHDAVLSADSRQVVTGRQLYQTNERVDRLDNRIKKVGANAAALAALRPGDFNPDDKFSIAAGFGSYRNANAAALGLFYRPNENVLLSLGTSFGDGENMVNAGVSVKFGRGKSMAERRKEMADEVSSMRDEMRSQDERIAELEEMLKKQSELIEKLSKES